jgi:hypothetical protein
MSTTRNGSLRSSHTVRASCAARSATRPSSVP